MIHNLPEELIFKIVNHLDNKYIYKLTITSKKLNKMNFQAILTSLLFSSTFNVSRQECIDLKNLGYSLGDYLCDLTYTNSLNMYNYETPKNKFIIKKTYRFNYRQEDLFEEKKLEDVKLHPIYRIPLRDYKILKVKKSQLLALIY